MNNRCKEQCIEPDWYKALTISERLVHLDGSLQHIPSSTAAGHKHLVRWQQQPPFNARSDIFQARLASERITEAQLLSLLSEPVKDLYQRIPEMPEWLTTLLAIYAFEEYPPLPPSLHEKVTNGPLCVIYPLLQYACQRLQETCQQLSENDQFQISSSLLEALFSSLLVELSYLMGPIMVLELHAANLTQSLPGETSEERYQGFIQRYAQCDKALNLLNEYPVLARQSLAVVQNWLETRLEFFNRLALDWSTLQNTFNLSQPLGCLVQIEDQISDPHNGGRQVFIVEFSGGTRLVYKPRSLSLDQHFQNLLQWLNKKGAVPPFKTLTLLNRQTYGWVEFVSPQPCPSEAAVRRFYRRQGGQLALVYALSGGDFHDENIIAFGEYPIMLDLEGLFHPKKPFGGGKTQAEQRANAIFFDSVISTLMLPAIHEASLEWDYGGIASFPNQTVSVPVLEGQGTDQMGYIHGSVAREKTLFSLPTLQGKPINPIDYRESITCGFSQIYNIVREHRRELLAEHGLLYQFADDHVRFIWRNTSDYYKVLRHCTQPDAMRNALFQEQRLDLLWGKAVNNQQLSRLIVSEKQDLSQRDIPIYSAKPGATHLWSGRGECFPHIFEQSALDQAREKITNFSDQDLQRQVLIVRAAFACLAHASATFESNPLPSPSLPLVQAPSPMALTRGIADQIIKRGIEDEESITWYGVFARKHGYFVGNMNHELYSGLSGIALFLAYLGQVSGVDAYTQMARKSTFIWKAHLEDILSTDILPVRYLGGFDGLGGHIYALTHLGVLWQDNDLISLAKSLVEKGTPLIKRDKHLNILSGVAGYLCCLLNLYTYCPQPIIMEAAVACGEHIRQQINFENPWDSLQKLDIGVGFAQGGAGIALALLKLAHHTGQVSFSQAATLLVNYERRLLHQADRHEVGWCHGLTGIGLARLHSLPHTDDPEMYIEVKKAVTMIRDQGFNRNHSLCHGDLGIIDFLYQAGRILHEDAIHQEVNQRLPYILSSIDIHGPFCGLPHHVEAVGLMHGLAGIGYGLLRMANPDQVPSVLSLDPPLGQLPLDAGIVT